MKKYSNSFFDAFDTIITVYGYTETEAKFNEYAAKIHSRFVELHELFDAYNSYDGINNIKTINENAGIKPVKVDKRIIEMLERSIELYGRTGGKVNVAIGTLTSLWNRYRERANENADDAALPTQQELRTAGLHMDIKKIIIDKAEGTVYLSDRLMCLDVGAVAKGFACQLVKDEMVGLGFSSFVISAGGNVCIAGFSGGRGTEKWSIGIQNPDTQTAANIVDTIRVTDCAVVTAGGYQRYYMLDGVRYHHIIDPDTLMPSNYFESVTVIMEDSLEADFMATTLFLLPLDRGMELASQMGICAFWIDSDGDVTFTEDYPQLSTLHSQMLE